MDSLHMSSDETDTEEGIERRRERRRESAVEPADEPVGESASRQASRDPLPISAADPIPFDAELAAVHAEAALLTRDNTVHNGLYRPRLLLCQEAAVGLLTTELQQ